MKRDGKIGWIEKREKVVEKRKGKRNLFLEKGFPRKRKSKSGIGNSKQNKKKGKNYDKD